MDAEKLKKLEEKLYNETPLIGDRTLKLSKFWGFKPKNFDKKEIFC
jgi:hypothetical protein